MNVPCFSPPPSEADDRATSPALSSSSRTTTSIPTDVSDISSLDGDDDYEVIDGPVPLQDDDTEHIGESLFHSQQGATIASELDGSSFLAPFPDQHDEYDADVWRRESRGSSLQASTSLATLSLEPDLIDSQSSSQLRFPDPLDESFQEERPNQHSSKGVQCSDTEDEQSEYSHLSIHPNDTLTPKIKQTDEPFPMKAKSDMEHTNVKKKTAILGPVGIPFNWNKKMILVNVVRAVMGLIVIILSTGVLPVWPGSNIVSKQDTRSCHGHPSSRKGLLIGHKFHCSSALTPSNALIIPPRNGSGVLSSMTSLMTRPTNKVLRPSSRSKDVMTRECNALSLYMAEIRSPKRAHLPICLDYIDGAAVCHSIMKTSRKKGRAAKENAQIITASARKKWHDYVQEMNEWLHGMSFVIVEAVRHQSLSIKQKTAREDLWGKVWKIHSQLMPILQQTWTEWMKAAHEISVVFWSFLEKESKTFRRDTEASYQTARVVLDRQYKQAVIAARKAQKNLAKDLQSAQKSLTKGALEAQKSWIKIWKEASASASMQRLQKDMNAAKAHVAKRVTINKEALRVAAINIKQAQIKRAARKRLSEIQKLRVKHREMMSLVREQSKVKHRASRLISKGKVAIYRKAIQSVQARHQVENMLGKMTSSGKKNIHNKFKKGSRKTRRQKKAAASGVSGRE